MNITFQKKAGNASLDLLFFWKLTVDMKTPAVISDYMIPELFFDYFFVKKGEVRYVESARAKTYTLSQQALKTIHTHPWILKFSTPLVLYGARFSIPFAKSFWEAPINANSFLRQHWVSQEPRDIESFASQVLSYVRRHRTPRNPYPMLSNNFEESDWLIHFSPRHKRRLYKTTFGLSRKELQNVHNIHSFLEQTCDFASQNPRIIQHVNPEVFYDQPHLNHTFRKMTGFSPVEYFEAGSILQDNLMSASYNESSSG